MLTSFTLAFVFFGTALSQTIIHPCDKRMFDSEVRFCRSAFNKSMETSGYWQGCAWPAVKRVYYDLKLCVDGKAAASLCLSRGSLVDDLFREVHQEYFASCRRIQDPPPLIVAALIAPLLVATLLMPFVCTKLVTREF
ncbi:receptor activity-modifying protein 1 isoform X2 [Syngnathus scovelli]|uniref:receptor activity-modifying protein 1 isoform X2 n=1 Tax=Syngnathus scovelli TaxID=161590 RepID=UPI0035CBC981